MKTPTIREFSRKNGAVFLVLGQNFKTRKEAEEYIKYFSAKNASEPKPYLWNEETGEVFCAYCGARGLKPNKHGDKAKTRTCATCGAKHKNESVTVKKEEAKECCK